MFDDGWSFTAANWAVDAVLRAVAAELGPGTFSDWLLARQSEHVGPGLTLVDLREIAPGDREAFLAAVEAACARARDHGFEALAPDDPRAARFGELGAMVRSWRDASPDH